MAHWCSIHAILATACSTRISSRRNTSVGSRSIPAQPRSRRSTIARVGGVGCCLSGPGRGTKGAAPFAFLTSCREEMTPCALRLDHCKEPGWHDDDPENDLLQNLRAGFRALNAALFDFLADHEAEGIVACEHDATRCEERVERRAPSASVGGLFPGQVRVVCHGIA